MSLFIPRVFSNITSERIASVFEKQGFGMVKRVDLVSQGEYNRAYVHFDFWCDSIITRAFKEKLLKKDQVRVVYDDPYYWIVLENTSTSYDPKKTQASKKLLRMGIPPHVLEGLTDTTCASMFDTATSLKIQAPKKRIQLDNSLQTKKVQKVVAPVPMTMPFPAPMTMPFPAPMPIPFPAPMTMPSIDYVHWLEQENWRLQHMLNYTFEQMEMDIVMEKEVEVVEDDMELEIQASLHEDVEDNNLWYQVEQDNMEVV